MWKLWVVRPNNIDFITKIGQGGDEMENFEKNFGWKSDVSKFNFWVQFSSILFGWGDAIILWKLFWKATNKTKFIRKNIGKTQVF